MGHVWVEIKVSDSEKKKSDTVQAIAGTGAMLTVLPQKLAAQLGIEAVDEEPVNTGGGPIRIKRGRAWIMVNGKEEMFRVWISDVIDKVLLGVVVLEIFGFKVDPTTGSLEEKPLLMY